MDGTVPNNQRRELAALVDQRVAEIEQLVISSTDDLEAESAVDFVGDPDARRDAAVARVDRRSFMRGTAAAVSAATIASTFQLFGARRAEASHFGRLQRRMGPCPYGEPVPTSDQVTGLPLLGLPPGFKYYSYGWTGDRLFSNISEFVTPPLHDGMGVLRQIGPFAVLTRNHEAGAGPSYIGGRLQYSPAAAGGNTNLLFDTRRRKWLAAWPSLSGTYRNCAGGTTPQGTWLSCEETTTNTMDADGNVYSHGWVFEVPAFGLSNGKPIKAMGRRSHEGASVDPRTGWVYLFEDANQGGVYRFKPRNRWRYLEGGSLEMLKITRIPNANLRGSGPLGGNGAPYPAPIGEPLAVSWVPVADPESLSPSNFAQGAALGGAEFRRPEGSWYAHGNVYFVSTDGGASGNGMVFSLDLRDDTLTLLYDAPSVDSLDNPDNLTVTPRGGLLFCEDNSGSPSYLLDGVSTERLVGFSREGELFTFANNLIDFSAAGMGTYVRENNDQVFDQNYRANEWAGACFDRSGDWLFVNIQTPGVTFAITGPWERGCF